MRGVEFVHAALHVTGVKRGVVVVAAAHPSLDDVLAMLVAVVFVALSVAFVYAQTGACTADEDRWKEEGRAN